MEDDRSALRSAVSPQRTHDHRPAARALSNARAAASGLLSSPPRATATTVRAHCGISVMPDVVGLPLLAEFADISYGFMHKMFYLTVYTVAPSLFSCVASRNKQVPLGTRKPAASTPSNWPPLPYFELNPAVRRTARAGRLPTGGPQTHDVRCVPPGRPTRPKAQPMLCPNSVGCGLRRPARDPKDRRSSALFAVPFCEVRPRRAPHAPLMRRPRRGRRPKGRTSTAQSTPQFSAPCQPHCGSADAPPLPSPAGISSRFCSPQNE